MRPRPRAALPGTLSYKKRAREPTASLFPASVEPRSPCPRRASANRSSIETVDSVGVELHAKAEIVAVVDRYSNPPRPLPTDWVSAFQRDRRGAAGSRLKRSHLRGGCFDGPPAAPPLAVARCCLWATQQSGDRAARRPVARRSWLPPRQVVHRAGKTTRLRRTVLVYG